MHDLCMSAGFLLLSVFVACVLLAVQALSGYGPALLLMYITIVKCTCPGRQWVLFMVLGMAMPQPPEPYVNHQCRR
jgi:hypothetical protein